MAKQINNVLYFNSSSATSCRKMEAIMEKAKIKPQPICFTNSKAYKRFLKDEKFLKANVFTHADFIEYQVLAQQGLPWPAK